MCEKLAHGKNGNTISNYEDNSKLGTPMSQKLYSDELLKTSPPLSQKLSYEKLSSEEMDSGKLGHPNINNNSTTNSFFEKEQGKNHQGPAPDDKKPAPLFSLEQAREIMRFDYWRRETLAWGKLKERLGHFVAPGDKARYERRTAEILNEIARRVRELLNSAQTPEHVAAMLDSEAFADFFDMVLTHWDEIRSTKGYVSASLENLLKPVKVTETH